MDIMNPLNTGFVGPQLKNHPELSSQSFSKFEEAANRLEADIAGLDKDVCELIKRLQLVLRPEQLSPPTQPVCATPAPPPPAPIVASTQGMSRGVTRLRDTIADILNRLEI